MGKYYVNGENKIEGKIKAECAKNAVLLFLAASVLTDGRVTVKNCPEISDVDTMINLLKKSGANIVRDGKDVIIEASGISSFVADEKLSKKARASVFLLGAFLSRFKKAAIYYPGGCKIGKRPIDLHISAFEKLGVKFSFNGDFIEASCGKITGGKVLMPYASVGATENVMLLCAVSDGTTEIINPAREPEIEDLQNFLNALGAKISGAGSGRITIEGVKKLRGGKYEAIGDRIEGGTFLLAAAITGGDMELKGVAPKNLYSFLNKLSPNTCKITVCNDIIYLKSAKTRNSFSFSTGPFPDFPTDLQPESTALACVSEGVSTVTETVFESRFSYADELKKMGAAIKTYGNRAVVRGVGRLSGAEVNALDLRGGAALVLAGLNAEGTTVINGTEYVKRGYSRFDEKLRSLGADIIER